MGYKYSYGLVTTSLDVQVMVTITAGLKKETRDHMYGFKEDSKAGRANNN